jgi:hypothetical protein
VGERGDERLRGVAGWLAFLVVIFFLLSPARTLITTWIELADAERNAPGLAHFPLWRTIKLYTWSMAFAASALSIYTGWRLGSVYRPSSVRLAIAALWFLGPGIVVLDCVVASLAFGASLLLDARGWSDLVRGVLAALVWTCYLGISRRVANTYYGDEAARAPGESGAG